MQIKYAKLAKSSLKLAREKEEEFPWRSEHGIRADYDVLIKLEIEREFCEIDTISGWAGVTDE